MSLRRWQKEMAARMRKAVPALSEMRGRAVVDTLFYCSATGRRLKPAPLWRDETGGAFRYTRVYRDLLKYILGACSAPRSAVISITSFEKRVVIRVLRNPPGSCLRRDEGIQATA